MRASTAWIMCVFNCKQKQPILSEEMDSVPGSPFSGGNSGEGQASQTK